MCKLFPIRSDILGINCNNKTQNLVRKSAFLNLFLIMFLKSVKSVLILFDLCKSPIITLRSYFLGILEFQGVINLVSLQ